MLEDPLNTVFCGQVVQFPEEASKRSSHSMQDYPSKKGAYSEQGMSYPNSSSSGGLRILSKESGAEAFAEIIKTGGYGLVIFVAFVAFVWFVAFGEIGVVLF